MANETVLTGLAHPTDVYSAAISAALVKKVVALPRIYSEDLPQATTVKYVNKDGSLASSTGGVSEGANYTTNSQYSRTGISVTVIKDVVSTFITVESLQFGSVDQSLLAQKIGEALGRELDNEILAKASGFSQAVTATTTLTVSDVMDAAYTVRKNLLGAHSGRLEAFLGYRGVHTVRKELMASAASVFANPNMTTLLSGLPATPNGYAGSLPGVDIFECSGHATGGGDDYQMVIDPAIALVGVYGAYPVMLPAIPVGKGNPSFGYEVSGLAWHGVSEWNDLAGCFLKSDS